MFNAEGQEVSSLLELESQQAGTYDIERDLSNLSAGIYLVQLKAEGNTETKRLLIQR